MADIKLKRGTTQTIWNANGSSLTAGARTAASSTEWDNSTDLCPHGHAEILVTFGSTPTDDRRISLYAVPALDGTNYVDGSDTVAPRRAILIGWAFVRNTTSSQRLRFMGASPDGRLHFPASKLKFIVQNDADQTISANWTLKIFPELWQSV